MNEIELWRTLKIPDPGAATIKSVLVRMRYPLTNLDKLEHFLIGVDEVTPDITNTVGELLVNPNKHFSLIPSYSGNSERFERVYDVRVSVETDIDPEAVNAADVLTYRFGYGDRILYVRRETVWGINFDPSLDRETIGNYVDQLTQTYFFANSNFQKSEVQFSKET